MILRQIRSVKIAANSRYVCQGTNTQIIPIGMQTIFIDGLRPLNFHIFIYWQL